MTSKRTSILFLTADPSDASRLRLGQELRDIQSRLQLSGIGRRFVLTHRASVRPADLTQAVFDTKPVIVHFSGHGAASGELLLENDAGDAHSVAPQALEGLFALYRNQVRCVILNACYSNAQALAISKHVEWVVGMRRAIGDAAAIAFAVGFYKALGAGRAIPECFEFGLVELRLHNISEYDTPVLLERDSPATAFLSGSYVSRTERGTGWSFPTGHPRYAKFLSEHPSATGCLLVDPEAYTCVGHLLDDIYTKHLHGVVAPFSYGTEWLLRLEWGALGPFLAPWEWVLAPGAPKPGVVPRWQRERPPGAFGLSRHVCGEILFLDEAVQFDKCVVVATNDLNACRLLCAGIKARLILFKRLREVPAEGFRAEDFRHVLVLPHGQRVLVDSGTDALDSDLLDYWLRDDG